MATASSLADVRSVLQGPFRVLAVGRLFDSIGSGLTMSLFVVYLAEVRGIPILTASLVLTWMAVLGLGCTPVVGTLTDRFGPRRVLLIAVLIEATGVALMSTVTTVPTAFAVAAVIAIGASGIWGPLSTFVAQVVQPEQRPTAFAVNFMLLNLGLGLGGLIGAAIVDISRPSTFTVLYLVDAATYACLWVSVLVLRGHGGPVSHEPSDPRSGPDAVEERGGWGQALRDRRLLGIVGVSLVLLTCGYGSMEAGLAIFIVDATGYSENLIGIVFLVNTMTIVIGQLVVLRWLTGRSRVRLIALVGVLWGVSWLMLASTLGLPHSIGVAVLLASTAVFALGETVWSPTTPALVNAIAPDHLRGRYNSAMSLSWSLGSISGPIIAGVLIGSGQPLAWTFTIAAGCLLAGVAALTLRPLIGADLDCA